MGTVPQKDPYEGMVAVRVTYTTWVHPEDLKEAKEDLLSALADYQGDPFASYTNVEELKSVGNAVFESPKAHITAQEAIQSRVQSEEKRQAQVSRTTKTVRNGLT